MTATNFISMEAGLPICKQPNVPAGTRVEDTFFFFFFASVDCKTNKKKHLQHPVVFELMYGEKKVQQQLNCSAGRL